MAPQAVRGVFTLQRKPQRRPKPGGIIEGGTPAYNRGKSNKPLFLCGLTRVRGSASLPQVIASGGYVASAADDRDAAGFYLKPSALGKYLIYGNDGLLLSAAAPVAPSVAPTTAPPTAETLETTGISPLRAAEIALGALALLLITLTLLSRNPRRRGRF